MDFPRILNYFCVCLPIFHVCLLFYFSYFQWNNWFFPFYLLPTHKKTMNYIRRISLYTISKCYTNIFSIFLTFFVFIRTVVNQLTGCFFLPFSTKPVLACCTLCPPLISCPWVGLCSVVAVQELLSGSLCLLLLASEGC
jgi:hypothetical protein